MLDAFYRLNGMFHGAAPGGLFARWRQRLNFSGPYTFTPRGNPEAKRLILIVAGYKPVLWDRIFRRIADAVPGETNVCVVVPQVQPGRLVEICERYAWSMLHLRANRLAVAQNLAIQLHPSAELIHKLDEDIVVPEDYFSQLEEGLGMAQASGRVANVGMVSPLLNVNGYAYRIFLEKMDLLADYERKFGPAHQRTTDHPIWKDPEAAKWIWERSLPFDEVARKISAVAKDFSCCWHQFSIGAILFRRHFWEAQQGFTASREGELGVEERDTCAFCMVNGYAIVVSHHVFAGHVGFGPQSATMLPWLANREGW